MKIIDPGHVYELEWLDGRPGLRCDWIDGVGEGNVAPENRLVFVKREGLGYPGNAGHHAGTNLQEVLRALIDRVKYLNRQIPDGRNDLVIKHLRGALLWLEDRAAARHGRDLDAHAVHIDAEIELLPTCQKCGYIGCVGSCHP